MVRERETDRQRERERERERERRTTEELKRSGKETKTENRI